MKIDHNTFETVNGTTRKIKLYNTDILTFTECSVILNSGGYKTNTTKDRMNKFLPNGWYVSQVKKQWYVTNPTGTVPFEDGMEIFRDYKTN